MAKTRTRHRCTECGAAAPRWAGRCGDCGAWNSIVEDTASGLAVSADVIKLVDVVGDAHSAIPTHIDELDRVLSGGLVPDSVTLLGGEPGIGKSTLLLQALGAIAVDGRRALLVSAEESSHQVRLRAERLGAAPPDLWLAADTELARILAAASEVSPDVLVVDSIQTIADATLPSSAGSVAQVQACAQALVEVAKRRNVSVVLVGHVTKDGALAGPRALEHLVDTVLSFEGERHHSLRVLRALKHRFGTTGEVGLFEMGEAGLLGVPDASGLLLADRRVGATGSIVVPAIEGRRPMLVEVQALVNQRDVPQPRRNAQGLDAGRVSLLGAVLDRHVGLKLAGSDVYASAVGGVRIIEPAADLGIAIAMASSVSNRPVAADVVACGEIGLSGEVRQVGQLPRRLAEAARLGFRTAIVPPSAADGPAGLRLVRVATVGEAIRFACASPPSSTSSSASPSA